jgi:AcrR family transcriptional regulator
MGKRAEQVKDTRLRITEAAVRLHTTIGAANTTISALAEEAGVTRLTVYNHFPDEEQLFIACQGHWMGQHPPPDPEGWLQICSFEDRALHGLGELYGWYSDNRDDQFPIQRDIAAMPLFIQDAMKVAGVRRADALVKGLGLRGRAFRRVRAAAGHAVSFWTWRSLVVDQGLSNSEAVTMAANFIAAGLRA